MSRALSACAVVGDFLRTAEGVVEFKRNPDVLLEDAVLHDHVMVWLEEAGLALIVEHDRLAVVGKQLPEARVAGELRAAPAVYDGRIAGSYARLRPDCGD
jgi:hypothetical protein